MGRLEISPEIVGRLLDPVEFEWQERDAILYALGVGARPPEDLDFLYEGRGPRVLPTYALIANWHAVRGAIEFGAEQEGRAVLTRGYARRRAA